MAAGTPIVVSDIPVFREIAGDAALYFDPHDPGNLADQLAALSDESRMAAARTAGAARAAAFTWDEAARVHAEVYREVSGE
jgi:glycosyltransferase involved in cell wall biosynthesis